MLVNNAGFSLVGKFEQLPSLELFQRVMAVNFNGVVQCIYYGLPHLKDSSGRIVNVSSLGGQAGDSVQHLLYRQQVCGERFFGLAAHVAAQ